MFALASALMYATPLAIFVAIVVVLKTRQVNRTVWVALAAFLPAFVIVWFAEYAGGYAYLLSVWVIGLGVAAVVNAALEKSGSRDYSWLYGPRFGYWRDGAWEPARPRASGKGVSVFFGLIAAGLLVFAAGGHGIFYAWKSRGVQPHALGQAQEHQGGAQGQEAGAARHRPQ